MLRVHNSKKNTPFVIASELYRELQIEEPFVKWFRSMIALGFKADIDHWMYFVQKEQPTGEVINVPEWSVRLDMAKHIALIQNNELGRQLRNYLLTLDQQKEDGALLTSPQIEALMDIAEVLGLFSVQKYLESEHHTQFIVNSKTTEWWDYRAKLFGLTADDVRSIIEKYGIKYESQRQALFHIDKFELVRRAAIDLFKVLGKSDEYAQNMGKTAKMLAERLKVSVYNDIGMSLNFNSDKQNTTIQEIQNYKAPTNLLKTF